MKLFYKPGACSLATHIVLRETGETFELDRVDTEKQKTESGQNFKDINMKGYVPALQLADGDVLTEGASILQFLADQNPESGLIPEPGSRDRIRHQEHLIYFASELHKAFGPLFTESTNPPDKEKAKIIVGKKFSYIESLFADGRPFLLGNHFSVADSYLFVITNWGNFVDIPLTDWPHLNKFVKRVSERPTVQAAMKAEGLLG